MSVFALSFSAALCVNKLKSTYFVLNCESSYG